MKCVGLFITTKLSPEHQYLYSIKFPFPCPWDLATGHLLPSPFSHVLCEMLIFVCFISSALDIPQSLTSLSSWADPLASQENYELLPSKQRSFHSSHRVSDKVGRDSWSVSNPTQDGVLLTFECLQWWKHHSHTEKPVFDHSTK